MTEDIAKHLFQDTVGYVGNPGPHSVKIIYQFIKAVF